MNKQDISNALLLTQAVEGRTSVILLCDRAMDIPYVKRELMQTLGAPSRMIVHELYYGDKSFNVLPSRVNISGFYGTVYYIAHEDDSDWVEMCIEAGVKQKQVPYELMPWMTVADIYNLMVADGCSGDEALHKMAIDGLIGGDRDA